MLLARQVNAQQEPIAHQEMERIVEVFLARSGNDQANSSNIFGTKWNSPIYFITGGLTQQTYRMKLNGNFNPIIQYPINAYEALDGVNTSGYLGLGCNMNATWSQNPSPPGEPKEPFSLDSWRAWDLRV